VNFLKNSPTDFSVQLYKPYKWLNEIGIFGKLIEHRHSQYAFTFYVAFPSSQVHSGSIPPRLWKWLYG